MRGKKAKEEVAELKQEKDEEEGAIVIQSALRGKKAKKESRREAV